jgi:hypothetical protein
MIAVRENILGSYHFIVVNHVGQPPTSPSVPQKYYDETAQGMPHTISVKILSS